MAYIILRNDNVVMYCGNNYTTGTDDLDPAKIVHIVDGFRFDDSFRICETIDAEAVPVDITAKCYKYENGKFVLVELGGLE